ncbi:protein Jade-1 isoform X2 [Mugil cephalus]|uniref:protein Jade-1 isoform X2 n=1 Tax=Mugil cephalus TaxID=48193 RepID=UPI001FB6FA78|nr:protein Jade-1 isoform X2 [Mugil cephalus]XP_047467632.1 protein Jade-1 isoform X2 [Mugil cephalus]XP_047467633.1 protein Jade-1 isoform X2 [Mugil cephalus]XP_047467634.1 protein Jade-1 isoform X2 [Mugil cephalus]XP_047467636.1 protein Jade-1 isoform X2 [Mugil cephalus]XP_047467637.1 protein Jade-1 isoform X2 [Mugil cephalus]XP_047467638.1 protein Jade-1 isoform X2 [Mugil cephalus]
MKRSRHLSSSDDSDNGSSSTCWSQHSSQTRRGTGQKPSEVFRTDLITAMKVHDSYQLNPEDYYVLADPWRQEWEKGVQVPVSPQSIPQPVTRVLAEKGKEVMFVKPKKLIRTSGTEALGYVDIRTLADGMCRYDLNQEDVAWLQIINEEFAVMAMPPLDELTMERVMEEFERCCHDNMTHAMETEEGLGIEYDEDVVCDVCQSPDGEDNNEMVFCDKCNICVHQACYGIQKVPKGSWLCRICALGILPKCQLCPKKGGAMKPTRSGTKWVHVSCALWIPEVSIGNPEKMEPITNVSHIPSNRWALICCLCKEKTGACIQCSAKNCRTAFHVTCGLHASLEMNTILTEDDEVKFKSYCPKHSGLEGDESRDSGAEEEKEKEKEKEAVRDKKGRRRGRVRAAGEDAASSSSSFAVRPFMDRAPGDQEALSSRQQEKRVSLRKLKLQEMEEEFYQFVGVEEVAGRLKVPRDVVDFVYQYWKLKRKANFNQPLLTPKKDEEESLARREQEVLLRRLQLFTHLRQDLERVRNLTYMVTRREKMKRSLWKVQEQIFQHQVRLLDHELLKGDPSAKDLEKLLSLDSLFSQGSHSNSSSSSSSSSTTTTTTKRGSSKQVRRKSSDRRAPTDSPHAHKKDNPSKALETKDARSSRVKEAAATEAAGDAKITHGSDGHQEAATPPKTVQETSDAKPHKPESRKTPRREAPPPPPPAPEQEAGRKQENEHEQEEQRRRRRRSEAAESFPSSVVKTRPEPKHLEKTVSIRLVDIRNSETDDFFLERGMIRRNVSSLDVSSNTKCNKAGAIPDAKPNGWLRRTQADASHAPNGPATAAAAAGGHLRSWGKFRIPRRSEKPPEEEEAASEQRKPQLRPLTNTPEPSYPRTRLRTGMESDEFAADSKAGDGELETLKRCHSHQLRGDSSLGRRYGSDIIRRGVLAS